MGKAKEKSGLKLITDLIVMLIMVLFVALLFEMSLGLLFKFYGLF